MNESSCTYLVCLSILWRSADDEWRLKGGVNFGVLSHSSFSKIT